jgi:hypothetical protein
MRVAFSAPLADCGVYLSIGEFNMANFCEACGSQLSGVEGFCWKCGAAIKRGVPQQQPAPLAGGYQQVQVPSAQPSAAGYQQQPQPAAPAPAVQFQQAAAPANPAYAPVPAAAPSAAPVATTGKKSSTWVTVLVVVIAVIFVGGLLAVGGVIYVAHRVSRKVHQISAAAGVGEGSMHKAMASVSDSDACRLLSKQEVGSALGVEIVATRAIADGCEYLAKGTAADMTARHMAALSSANGADSQQQEMIHKFAGGVFAQQQKESHEGEESDGNVPVFVFAVDQNGAAAQMKLTGGVMGMLGPGQKQIAGIGDEALDESGAMMLVRKGDKLIRITYTTCPCGTDAIKPLARKLADSL